MRSLFVALSIGVGFALAVCKVPVLTAAPSGFQGTVNHYRVGMHAGCPQTCSQWMNPDFQAFPTGHVDSPITIQNDTLVGFCGSIKMVVRDSAAHNPPGVPLGRVLGTFISPEICIKGKDPFDGHARTEKVNWSFDTSPEVGQLGADLYGVVASYKSTGLDFPWGDLVLKIVAPAVISVL